MYEVIHIGPCGATDNASDYGSEDSRFESWQGRFFFLSFSLCSHLFFLAAKIYVAPFYRSKSFIVSNKVIRVSAILSNKVVRVSAIFFKHCSIYMYSKLYK